MDDSNIKGRARGGKKRAENLSPEDRKKIAQKAAAARWGEKLPRVTHTGNFKTDFGIDVDCYVLDDAAKTAVISQRGMAQAIGLSKRGDRLTVFAGSKTMGEYLGRDLREKLANPIIFQRIDAAAENPIGARAHGYDATILIDLCKAIVAARKGGKLSSQRYDKMVSQAEVVLSASAKAGIKVLVYALAGYSPAAQEFIEAFKVYVREEAKKYEREFPNELYAAWYRLYDIPVPERGKPWQFKELTVNHVYYPLAKSSGKVLQLLRALRDRDKGGRKRKLFQFLSDVGARALRIQLGRVLEMCDSSRDRATYETRIAERFPREQGDQWEFNFEPPDSTAPGQPS